MFKKLKETIFLQTQKRKKSYLTICQGAAPLTICLSYKGNTGTAKEDGGRGKGSGKAERTEMFSNSFP